MYDGHLKNIQHLYLYGKATEARLLEVEEDEECDWWYQCIRWWQDNYNVGEEIHL